jgi:hypothetical protein
MKKLLSATLFAALLAVTAIALTGCDLLNTTKDEGGPVKVATPAALPGEGALLAGDTVALSTETEGALIYYTLDGSTPTGASTLYANPIPITQAVTIKAIAVKAGYTDSDILEAVYTVSENENPPASISISIATAEDFAKIGKDAEYPLDGIYTIEAGITLVQWNPVGSKGSPFTGEIRGNGKTITLQNFSAVALQEEYIGVLGYASGAKVTNMILSLGLSSRTIIRTPSQGDQIVGGLAAYALRSEFTGIRVEGDLNLLKSTSRTGLLTAGGIAGVLERSTIRNSVSTVTITGRVNDSSSGITAGGIAGRADLSAIFTSHYTGTLDITSFATTVGGIAATLMDGRSSPAKYGGDFGIYDCSASGTITFAHHGNAGGIVANCSGSSSYNPGVISGCAAKITISGSIYQVHSMSTPSGMAGGVAAQVSHYGIITDSYSSGNVTINSPSYHSVLAGGIAANIAEFFRISRCYASGMVSATNAAAHSPFWGEAAINIYAGGIGGRILLYNGRDAVIENCAALNHEIKLGKYSEDGPGSGPRRIADTGGYKLSGNIANKDMVVTVIKDKTQTPDPPAMEKTADGMDGEDCDAKPGQSVFAAMGWDFTDVWKTGGDGYPVLAWEE